MSTFDPQHTLPDLLARLKQNDGLLIVCYCAQWCDTCGDYQNAFNELSEKWPQYTFIWVDIEESPDLLGDIDIENFPTILIQSKTANLFFSPLLPYISHLERLLSRSHDLGEMPDNEGPPLLRPLLMSA